MVESLVRLENQVGKLIHHFVKDGESLLHKPHTPHTSESAKRFDEPTEPHEGRLQRPLEPIEESLRKLEQRLESLVAQVAGIMRDRQKRFEMVGENIVPPPRKGSALHNGGWGENGDGHEDGGEVERDEIVSQ